MLKKISANVNGGRADALACADPEARTPIGVSEIIHLAGNTALSWYLHRSPALSKLLLDERQAMLSNSDEEFQDIE